MKPSAAGPAAFRRHAPRLLALLTALIFVAAFFLSPVRAATTDADQVLVPSHAAGASAPGAPAGAGMSSLTIVAVILLAGAGGWMLWRKRTGPLAARVPHNLAVDETRALGNRQFLVVASYQGKKFLLGVCPGRIDLLAPLHESVETGK